MALYPCRASSPACSARRQRHGTARCGYRAAGGLGVCGGSTTTPSARIAARTAAGEAVPLGSSPTRQKAGNEGGVASAMGDGSTSATGGALLADLDDGVRKAVSPRRRFRCTVCDRRFSSGQALGGHSRMHAMQQRAEEEMGRKCIRLKRFESCNPTHCLPFPSPSSPSPPPPLPPFPLYIPSLTHKTTPYTSPLPLPPDGHTCWSRVSR
ncbi:unnamed protein product [Closterium sp. NIES-54]